MAKYQAAGLLTWIAAAIADESRLVCSARVNGTLHDTLILRWSIDSIEHLSWSVEG
jgi:hypothetical protein